MLQKRLRLTETLKLKTLKRLLKRTKNGLNHLDTPKPKQSFRDGVEWQTVAVTIAKGFGTTAPVRAREAQERFLRELASAYRAA